MQPKTVSVSLRITISYTTAIELVSRAIVHAPRRRGLAAQPTGGGLVYPRIANPIRPPQELRAPR